MLTQERLKDILDYNPDTGEFTWKVGRKGGAKVGDVAGGKNTCGHIQIRIDGVKYMAHRLAWLYMEGYLPENSIDHIDRNPSNNRIRNLREASRTCNMRNTGNPADNTSGVKGVHHHKQSNKWQAMIAVAGKNKYLGVFDDFGEAVCHRLAAEQCIGWSSCDSLSPAKKYVNKLLGGECE